MPSVLKTAIRLLQRRCTGDGVRGFRSIDDHAIVQTMDRFAAGGYKRERKNGVSQAGESTHNHRNAEARRVDKMFEIGFVDVV